MTLFTEANASPQQHAAFHKRDLSIALIQRPRPREYQLDANAIAAPEVGCYACRARKKKARELEQVVETAVRSARYRKVAICPAAHLVSHLAALVATGEDKGCAASIFWRGRRSLRDEKTLAYLRSCTTQARVDNATAKYLGGRADQSTIHSTSRSNDGKEETISAPIHDHRERQDRNRS